MPIAVRMPLLALALLLALPAALQADEVTLRGRVADATGRPLGQVVVEASSLGDSEWSAAATSDAKGRFELAVPEPGEGIVLELSRTGFRTAVRRLRAEDLADRGKKKLEVTLLAERALGGATQGFTDAKAAWEAYESGLAVHRAGRRDDARRLFERALALEPTLAPANAAIALLDYEDGEHASAVEAANLFLVHAEPQAVTAAMSRETRKVRRDALFALGDCALALPAAVELLDEEPRDVEGLKVRIACLLELGRDAEAEAVIAELERADSLLGAAIAVHNLGVHQFKRGERAEAAKTFATALELDPALVPAWSGLAKSHVLDRRWADAAEAAARLLALRPEDLEGLAIRYDSLTALGRHSEAAPLLARLAELDPTPLTARRLHQAGYRAIEGGDAAAARPLFERAAEIDPELVVARRALAIACYRLEDYRCAIDVSADLLAEDPGDEASRRQLEKARRALAER